MSSAPPARSSVECHPVDLAQPDRADGRGRPSTHPHPTSSSSAHGWPCGSPRGGRWDGTTRHPGDLPPGEGMHFDCQAPHPNIQPRRSRDSSLVRVFASPWTSIEARGHDPRERLVEYSYPLGCGTRMRVKTACEGRVQVGTTRIWYVPGKILPSISPEKQQNFPTEFRLEGK